MTAKRRQRIIFSLRLLYILPFILSVGFTYAFLIIFSHIAQLPLEGTTQCLVLIFSIVYYILFFCSDVSVAKPKIWLLGGINAGVWVCMIVYLILDWILKGNGMGEISWYTGLVYMGLIAFLNYSLYKYDKSGVTINDTVN